MEMTEDPNAECSLFTLLGFYVWHSHPESERRHALYIVNRRETLLSMSTLRRGPRGLGAIRWFNQHGMARTNAQVHVDDVYTVHLWCIFRLQAIHDNGVAMAHNTTTNTMRTASRLFRRKNRSERTNPLTQKNDTVICVCIRTPPHVLLYFCAAYLEVVWKAYRHNFIAFLIGYRFICSNSLLQFADQLWDSFNFVQSWTNNNSAPMITCKARNIEMSERYGHKLVRRRKTMLATVAQRVVLIVVMYDTSWFQYAYSTIIRMSRSQ